MYKSIVTVKNLETTTLEVLTDNVLFSCFAENRRTNFLVFSEMMIASGYAKTEEQEPFKKFIFQKEDIIITFETQKISKVILHDIYNGSINMRSFDFFINWVDNIYTYGFDKNNKSKVKIIQSIIDNSFFAI